MSKINRRDFLKHSAAGVTGMALLPPMATAQSSKKLFLPPHRQQIVPGVHGYAAQSVEAGQPIGFHISSTVPYRFSICRLGHEVDNPKSDTVLFEFPEAPAGTQPIHPGSYIHVEKNIRQPLKALTLECWVRPWKINAWAGLVTQYNYSNECGFGLFLNNDGGVSFYLGDGGSYRKQNVLSSSAKSMKASQWAHVVATWDGAEKILWLNGKSVARGNYAGPAQGGLAPLRLAAYGEFDGAANFLDGDLAMPVIYNRTLSAEEIKRRFEEKGLKRASGRDVLGCWTFSEEQGDVVADVSAQNRPGRIINHATWMIGGPSFQAEVPRFGDYNPRKDPTRGHGLRFASDDLYDCRWKATLGYRIPSTAKSGFYVGRLRYEMDGKPHLYHISFIVKKPARRKKAPILLLASTNTWRAYNATAFVKGSPELNRFSSTQGIQNADGNPPAFSFYRKHAAGQGSYQLGLRMPFIAADPYLLYGVPTGYSHLLRAERFAQIWLEQEGYDYDLVTDLDLHQDPGMLSGYKTLIINGHSEYWSLPMYHGLERYFRKGGNVLCLSGNSMLWRVSFNREGTVIECRKVDAPGDQVPAARRGEAWHSQDGLRGGLLRECGYPGWKLIGLDIIGWNNPSDPKMYGPYIVERPEHFLFNFPENTGLNKGDAFGQAPDGGMPRSNAHEADVRPSVLLGLMKEPPPQGAVPPKDPEGILRIANGVIPWDIGGSAFDYYFRKVKPETPQGGEFIYWERPDGGRIVNAAAIASGWVLSVDPKMRMILRNALHHFGVPRPR